MDGTQIENKYMYIIVRKDISPEQQSVQAIHASIESTRKFCKESEKDWEHPHIVLCGVKNENSLLSAILRLEKHCIPFEIFREPDLNNEITAIATSPICGEQREIMSRYNLLIHKKEVTA